MVTAKRLKRMAIWNERRLAKKDYKQSIKSTLKQLKKEAKDGSTYTYLQPPYDERIIEFLRKRGFECEMIQKHIGVSGRTRDVTMLKVKWE